MIILLYCQYWLRLLLIVVNVNMKLIQSLRLRELRKWNVDVSSTYDTITIVGKETYRKDGVEIHGHNDHRIVMAMTIFGLCAQSPCIIDDAQAITKSYPNFFQDIQAIGGRVEIL